MCRGQRACDVGIRQAPAIGRVENLPKNVLGSYGLVLKIAPAVHAEGVAVPQEKPPSDKHTTATGHYSEGESDNASAYQMMDVISTAKKLRDMVGVVGGFIDMSEHRTKR